MSIATWFDLFPATKVITLLCTSSNQSPILVQPDGINTKPKRPWRFEQMWLEEQDAMTPLKMLGKLCPWIQL